MQRESERGGNAGLPPCVSGDRGNNEKLCRDFKANVWSFPVVMADTGLHVQATSTHTLSHTFLAEKTHQKDISFDGIVQPRSRRNKTLDVE